MNDDNEGMRRNKRAKANEQNKQENPPPPQMSKSLMLTMSIRRKLNVQERKGKTNAKVER